MGREQEILKRYEGWNPDEETIAELVESLAISRQRLYQVLDKYNVVPKSRRQKRGGNSDPRLDDRLLHEMAEMALGYLFNQLQEARNELAEYRRSGSSGEKPGPDIGDL